MMKKNYSTPEIEIVETLDIVVTSNEVESERIPLTTNDDNYNL